MYNGINIHFPIVWDDGMKWLLRVRQSHNGRPNQDIQKYVIQSEIGVLRLLKRQGLLVPDAWPAGDGNNESANSDIHYFFYEFIPGSTLVLPKRGEDALWSPGERIRRIIHQYAKFQVQISENPIAATQIGCPTFASGGQIAVGPLANHQCLNSLDPPNLPGPFSNNQERYLAQIDLALGHIAAGHLCQNAPLDGYLYHLLLRELVQQCSLLAEQPSEVYIEHADDKGDQFMGNDKNDFTGVIDWECPAEEILVEAYEALERKDLADCVRNGKIYQRLSHIGNFNDTGPRHRGILDAFKKYKPPGLEPPLRPAKELRVYLINRYEEGDTYLPGLMQREGWDQAKEKAVIDEAEAAWHRKYQEERALFLAEMTKGDAKAKDDSESARERRRAAWQAAKTKQKANAKHFAN
ncbi:uncharacterized protein I303_103189 [Kwoniella dejecticola CBS 10117]|uniref:Aminoglycoside phosphotransferase domain-containing protein n=1 Tax=Kwoniella dejecticola CBS 10117 TaxID=1296121 RepID=A0AAJ8KMZ3_9TREE